MSSSAWSPLSAKPRCNNHPPAKGQYAKMIQESEAACWLKTEKAPYSPQLVRCTVHSIRTGPYQNIPTEPRSSVIIRQHDRLKLVVKASKTERRSTSKRNLIWGGSRLRFPPSPNLQHNTADQLFFYTWKFSRKCPIITPFSRLLKERYPSGWRGWFAKPVGGRMLPRGFESLPLRQL